MLPKRKDWKLRPYQQEAVDALIGSWGQGWEEGQVWASVCAQATGLGKTRCGLAVIQQFLQPGQRALWLAHRSVLCDQAEERARHAFPDVNVGVVKAENNDVHAHIIIGSVQTLCRASRMQELLAAGKIDLIVTDECLPSGANVLLADGSTRTIGDLVATPDKPEVVCYNEGVLTTRPVTKLWKMEPKAPLVRVVHEQGELICTGNHRLLTQDGWVPAGLLEVGHDHLFALRPGVQERARTKQAHGPCERQVQQAGTEAAPRGHPADYGVPGPSLVLSVEPLPDQEQWVYDLTVDEVHNFIADGVVVSNCHHSPSDSYLRIYRWLRAANSDIVHVGLTATPWRGDGKWAMSDELFQAMPEGAQKNIRWGIKHGYLVPPNGLQIETGVSLKGVQSRMGDFVASELADVLDAAEWHKLVVDAYEKHCWIKGENGDEGRWMTALAFTPDVATSQALAAEFQERGHNAVHIDANTSLKDRRPVEAGFRKREIQIVSNCLVYGEGADFPSAECILMARPTQSHGLLTQIVGRGLRPYPGKEECLVLMFATTDAHILTIFDLGKSKELAEAEEKAKELGVVEMSGPVKLFDDDLVDGVGVEARTVSLFGGSVGAWYRGDQSIYSLGLGESGGYERSLIILPPNGDGNWRLMGIGRRAATSKDPWSSATGKPGPWQVGELAASPDVEELMDMAHEVVERRACDVLTHKKKKWRKDPATQKQVAYLKSLGARPTVADALLRRKGGKGDAARLITHLKAVNVLRVKGWVS